MASRAYWFGLIVGALPGFALGFVVAYGMGDRTEVIPLTQGIKT